MKKIYQQPKIITLKVELQKMMSESLSTNGESITTQEGFGSRRGSVWDDEDSWEEDY